MKRRGKRGNSLLLAGVLAGAGCADPAARPEPATAGPSAPVARDDYARAEALWQAPVGDDDFARRTLYTWTTAEQIAELRTSQTLLTRATSPVHGASYFEQLIARLSEASAIAQVLHSQSFAKSRYAWPSPWATRAGWPGEQYGDQLVRVTLKPSAIVLALSTSDLKFRARDLAGQPVAESEVLAHPERIGAVYFTPSTADRGVVPRSPGTYREYVLPNEAMIDHWAIGTPDIATEIAAETDALSALARGLATHGPSASVRRAFTRARALASPAYALEHDAIASLANTMRATPVLAPPLEVTVTLVWAGLQPQRTDVRPPGRKVRGTYGTFGSY